MHLVSDQDRVSVVAFDNKTDVVFPLTHMVGQNLEANKDKLMALRTRNTTNIWKGLECAMDTLREETFVPRRKIVLLLTDGEPNEHPAEGELQALRDYMDRYPKFKF